MDLRGAYRDQNYGTLLVPLAWALCMTDRSPVIELGAGVWSTPFLHQWCAFMRQDLYTVEPNDEWRSYFVAMQSDTHLFLPVPPDTKLTKASVVLVDSMLPSERARELLELEAEVFVLHDAGPTDVPNYPGLAVAIDTFKYTRLFDQLYPATMLLSRSKKMRKAL